MAEMLRAPPCRMCILPAASRFTRFSFIRYSDWIKGYLKKAAFFIFQVALCFEAARTLSQAFPWLPVSHLSLITAYKTSCCAAYNFSFYLMAKSVFPFSPPLRL